MPGPLQVRGNSVRTSENVTELEGKAEAQRDGEQINADYLRYDRENETAQARGNVTVKHPNGGEFTTSEAHINLDTGAGEAAAGTFRVPGGQGRGDMSRIEFLDHDHSRLRDVRYTTCPAERDDWYLRAKTLDLNTEEDIGTARHVTLHFFNVPLLYLPYLSFPISDERKSGFLIPQIGYGSKQGAVVAAPYYLNLAPNYDATLTPRLMTERGLQVQSQLRYLTARSSGKAEIEYLPDDKVTNDNRGAAAFIHHHNLGPRWDANIDLRRVSDRDYLNDFGDHLRITSETHLPQNGEITYRGSQWNFTARAADYQTIDRSIAASDRPYARLPQLLLSGRSPGTSGQNDYRFEGEFVNFHRDIGVVGERLNLNPAVRMPISRSYGFATPEIGLRHIAYALDGTDDDRPTVTAPYTSLDSGLFFERPFSIGNSDFLQTLEPRLFYLYVPYRAQDTLPNFDTTLPDFTFDNLFRTNRFLGGDRIGDTNQVTMALTTRFIDDSNGAERVRASIGRIHYFNERRVNLPAGELGDASSDVAAEAIAWLPGNWHVRATSQWAPEREETARSSYYLQYNPASDKIVNIGHRYIRNELEQADVSFEWPLGGPWIGRARSLYSTRDHSNVESFVGLEYRSCCWALRLYGSRRLTQVSGISTVETEQRGHFMLEIELTGLGSSGGVPESPLRQSLFSSPIRSTP